MEDLLHLNLLPENWPEYISRSNSCSTFQCRNCDNFGPTVSFSMELSTILFVEFNEVMLSVALFQSDIVVESSYQLVAMVRHIGSHFTCAIKETECWVLVDDLQDSCHSYDSLQKLHEVFPVGWFFAVYVKSDEISNMEKFDFSHFRQDTVITTEGRVLSPDFTVVSNSTEQVLHYQAREKNKTLKRKSQKLEHLCSKKG